MKFSSLAALAIAAFTLVGGSKVEIAETTAEAAAGAQGRSEGGLNHDRPADINPRRGYLHGSLTTTTAWQQRGIDGGGGGGGSPGFAGGLTGLVANEVKGSAKTSADPIDPSVPSRGGTTSSYLRSSSWDDHPLHQHQWQRSLGAPLSTTCSNPTPAKIRAIFAVNSVTPVGITVNGLTDDWVLSTSGPDFVTNVVNAGNFDTTFGGYTVVGKLYLRYSCADQMLCALVKTDPGYCLSGLENWFKDYTVSTAEVVALGPGIVNVVENGNIVGWEGCFPASVGCHTGSSASNFGVQFHASYKTCGAGGGTTASSGKGDDFIGLELGCPYCGSNPDGSVCPLPPPASTDGNCCAGTCVEPSEACLCSCTTDILCPPFATVECGESLDLAGDPSVSNFGTCGDNIAVEFTSSDAIDPGTGCPATIRRTWTAHLSCGPGGQVGRTHTCEQEITFSRDILPPDLLNVPMDQTQECQAAAEEDKPRRAVVASTVAAFDQCQGYIIPGVTTVTSAGCGGTMNVTTTYTATDSCNNSASDSSLLWIRDTTAPTLLGVPSDITDASCDDVPPASTDVTAEDACDASVSPVLNETNDIIADLCRAGKSITRNWTVTDACGNTASQAQVITLTDEVPPVFTTLPPAGGEVSCAEPLPDFADLLAEDTCGTATVRKVEVNETTGECTQNITVNRTWTAEDLCGNPTSVSQTFKVYDTTAPVLSGVPSDTTLACDKKLLIPPVEARDSCDRNVVISRSEVTDVVKGECQDGRTINSTWLAADSCGNNISSTLVITLTDKSPPTLYGGPPHETVECSAIPTVAAITGSDSCGGVVNVSMVETNTTSGACADRSITRVWTGLDVCGNAATHTQVLTIDDWTAPTLTCPPDVTIACDNCTTPTHGCLGLPTVVDNCDAAPTYTYSDAYDPPSLLLYSVSDTSQTLTRTFTATDDCGNPSSCTQTVTKSGVLSEVKLKRTVNGAVDRTTDALFELYQGPPKGGYLGGMKLAAASTLNDADGVIFDVFLNPTLNYTICERNIGAGWSFKVSANGVALVPYNADSGGSESLGNICVDFQPKNCSGILNIVVDHTRTGGCPRTPGYWKNWNNCTGSKQCGTARKNGGAKKGYYIVDDLLPIVRPDWNGDTKSFTVRTCQVAVQILSSKTLSTCQSYANQLLASDPVVNLAKHLLAAQLNAKASACLPATIATTIKDAEKLLDTLNYQGCKLSTSCSSTQTNLLRSYATALDAYNNGRGCPGCCG